MGPLTHKGELSGLGRPLVGAGEVADEGFSEIYPVVDVVGLEAVQPGPSRALKHQGDVLHDNTLVSVCYVDCGGVVDQPVLRLHKAIVFGRVYWDREPFGEGLIANAGARTRWADRIFFF